MTHITRRFLTRLCSILFQTLFNGDMPPIIDAVKSTESRTQCNVI